MVTMTKRAYELRLLSEFAGKQRSTVSKQYESICGFINKNRFETIKVCPVCGFLMDKNKTCKICGK